MHGTPDMGVNLWLSGSVPGEVRLITLTSKEIALIFDTLAEKYGRGYSQIPEVGQLQAKLSILAEIAQRRESVIRDRVPSDK
jgi:hypothetical protein